MLVVTKADIQEPWGPLDYQGKVRLVENERDENQVLTPSTGDQIAMKVQC